MIAALAGKPTEHLAQKMEKLGVYDLQTLKVAIAVLRFSRELGTEGGGPWKLTF